MSIMEKVKHVMTFALGVIAVVVVVLASWFLTAWLYPDEWFADIPKLVLGLLFGLEFD